MYRDQEFSADMGSRARKRIEDVRILRAAQFPEDASPMAHPIRPEKYAAIDNFYTATVYNKGAEAFGALFFGVWLLLLERMKTPFRFLNA